MTTLQREYKLANSYLTFIKNLSTEVKLDIISKISLSLIEKEKKVSEDKPDSYFFGIWDSEQSAEEIVAGIKNSEVSTRKLLDLD